MAEQIINNAMKICDAENLEELALFSPTLDWFIIETSYMYNQDQKFDFDSIDASMYDEPIDYNSILDLLGEKEINDYNLPSINEVFKGFKHIDKSSFNDTRFLLRRHTPSDLYFRSGAGAPGRFLSVCDESMEAFHLSQKPLIHQRVKFYIKNFIPCILHDR